MFNPVGVTAVDQDDPDTRVEEGEFAIAMLKPFEVELSDLEGFRARQEGYLGALLPLGRLANDLQRGFRVAVAEAHEVLFTVAPDGEVEMFAKRVDHADTDAVKAAGNLVGILVAGVFELTAGVELGHDDLGRRNALLRVDTGRNSAPIILDADRPIGI